MGNQASWSQPQHLGRVRELPRDIGGCIGTARITHTAGRQMFKGRSLFVPHHSPVLPNLPTCKRVLSLLRAEWALQRGRVWVVSWTRVTWPLLQSVFNSVYSLAQTYDLCCLWQRHPSPRRPFVGVRGVRGSHRVAVAPASFMSPALRWQAWAQPAGKCWGEGVDHGAQSRYWAGVLTPGTPSPRPPSSAQPASPLLPPSLSRALCLISY